MKVIRKCDTCGKEYIADTRDINRGWGLCCSKSCAAKKRESSTKISKARLEARRKILILGPTSLYYSLVIIKDTINNGKVII